MDRGRAIGTALSSGTLDDSTQTFATRKGLDSLDKAARARLETHLTSEQAKKYAAVFITRLGSPARETLDYLSTHGEIDLVVMATAGRGAVGRLLMGSVADKIVRAAPYPALTIYPREASTAGTATHAV